VTEFTVQYGAFRHTLVHFFKPAGAQPPPSVVVLFRKHAELLRWAAQEGNDKLISASTEPDHTAVLAVALAGYRSDALATAFESDTEDTLPHLGYFLPLWMRQGTAEVFASVYLDRGQCFLGEPQARLTSPLDSDWLPWDRFFDVGLSSPEYKGTIKSGVYQAQAWLLMHEVLLTGELRRNNHAAAVGYYRAAIQSGSADPDAFAVSAADRMDQSSSGGIDYPGDCGTEGAAVLAETRQAVALDRGEIYYWQLLGRAFFVAPAVSPDEVTELSQAISDDPGGLEVRYYRGLLYSRLGRIDDCRADVQYVLQNKATSSYRRHWAQSYLAHLDFDRDRLTVNSLAKERRFSEAQDLLNQRLKEGVDGTVRANYESLQRYVDEFEDWHKADDLRQNRQWSELLEATTSFLDKYPLSANRRVIRNWQQLAQRELALPPASGQP
jgi:hypothetical protein